MKYIVCSYYTKNTGYEIEIERLRESLNKFNLIYYFKAIDSLGSWDLNTRYKAIFLKEMLEKFNRPIVFLDADAEVIRDPILFEELDCDIAVYQDKQVRLLSGTLYLGNTDNAKEIVNLWIHENKVVHNSIFEQYNLKTLLERDTAEHFNVYILPPEYCYIPKIIKIEVEPRILHHQASRRLKKEINAKGLK